MSKDGILWDKVAGKVDKLTRHRPKCTQLLTPCYLPSFSVNLVTGVNFCIMTCLELAGCTTSNQFSLSHLSCQSQKNILNWISNRLNFLIVSSYVVTPTIGYSKQVKPTIKIVFQILFNPDQLVKAYSQSKFILYFSVRRIHSVGGKARSPRTSDRS